MTLQYDLWNIAALSFNYKYITFFFDGPETDTSIPDSSNMAAPQSTLNVFWNYIDNHLALVAQNPFTVTMDGTIQSFRIYNYSGTCVIQGTVSLAGDGGDLILDSLDVTVGQVITMTEVTIAVNVS